MTVAAAPARPLKAVCVAAPKFTAMPSVMARVAWSGVPSVASTGRVPKVSVTDYLMSWTEF